MKNVSKKIFLFFIVSSFIDRNQRMKTEIQEKYAKQNLDKEKRHDDNAKKLIEENQQLAKAAEEKEFQKYITYYFMKKNQRMHLSHQRKMRATKFNEKVERLEELEKKDHERRKNLLKKIQTLDSRRAKYIQEKFDNILHFKMKRDENLEKCLQNQKEIEEDEFKRREIILANQTISITRSMNIDRKNDMKRMAAGDKTINNQIAILNSMFIFNKKLNELKSKSVTKLTKEEKLKIFRELKRKEAEKRKKQLEDEMLDKMIK